MISAPRQDKIMTDGTKHNHHTVPQFYLRGFSKKGKKEKVTEIKLPGDTYVEKTIRKASVIIDYYLIKPDEFQSPDLEPDIFEDWLDDEFESPTGKVFQKINGGEWPLRPDDRATLAKFITLQLMRVPTYRDSIDDAMTAVALATLALNGRENLKSEIRKNFGVDYDEESLDEIWHTIEDGTFRVENHSKAHLVSIMENLPEMVHYISGRAWFLVKFSRKTLFTSDSPVVVGPALYGVPAGLANAPEIMFPLNRATAIIMGHPSDYLVTEDDDTNDIHYGKYDVILPGNTLIHKQLTAHIIHNAKEYLYCHPDDREKLPKDLPQPKQPRNFKDEAEQFMELGESMRNSQKPVPDDIPSLTGDDED